MKFNTKEIDKNTDFDYLIMDTKNKNLNYTNHESIVKEFYSTKFIESSTRFSTVKTLLTLKEDENTTSYFENQTSIKPLRKNSSVSHKNLSKSNRNRHKKRLGIFRFHINFINIFQLLYP